MNISFEQYLLDNEKKIKNLRAIIEENLLEDHYNDVDEYEEIVAARILSSPSISESIPINEDTVFTMMTQLALWKMEEKGLIERVVSNGRCEWKQK